MALLLVSVLLLFSKGTLPVWGAGLGQQLGQPPRPTLTPTLVPPTTVPKHDTDDEAPVLASRITGTVIDLTSGAPAPEIAVLVGDSTITTDANGNYDRNGLQPGNYRVALALTEGQGIPAQEPITVELPPGVTVVQHLAFRSQLRAISPPMSVSTRVPNQPAALPATGESRTDTQMWILIGITLIISGMEVRRVVRQKKSPR